MTGMCCDPSAANFQGHERPVARARVAPETGGGGERCLNANLLGNYASEGKACND